MERIFLWLIFSATILSTTVFVAAQQSEPSKPSYGKPSRTSDVDEIYEKADYTGRAEENGLYEKTKGNFFAVDWSPQFRVRLEKALRENKDLQVVVRGDLRYFERPELTLSGGPTAITPPERYTLLHPDVQLVNEQPMLFFETNNVEHKDRKPISLTGVALEDFATKTPVAYILAESGLVQLDAPWSPVFRNVIRRAKLFYDSNVDVTAEAISLRRTDPETGLALYRLTAIKSAEPTSNPRTPLVTKTGKGGLPLVDGFLQAAGLVGQQVLLDGKFVFDEKTPDRGAIVLRHFRSTRPLPINAGILPLVEEFDLVPGESVRVSARISGRNGLSLDNVKIEGK